MGMLLMYVVGGGGLVRVSWEIPLTNIQVPISAAAAKETEIVNVSSSSSTYSCCDDDFSCGCS